MTMNTTNETLTLESPEQAANVPSGGVGSSALLGSVSATCEDCMALMARYPDKHFDLAIVDPPYSDRVDGLTLGKGRVFNLATFKKPGPGYFAELRRVSREQIVWGGNWLSDMLPPSSGFVVWNKHQNGQFSECEIAWVSHGKARHFDRPYQIDIGNKIHPTQKPVELYRWLLERYATPGQRILDTHLGSGSHAIACHYAGMHLTACEIDADYFAAAQERIARETRQTTLF
jgi:site-specific DNA-methyltransferase (adenine-specific)